MRSQKDVKFAMVPEPVFQDGSPAAIKVWCGLAMFANHANRCWPSQKELAEYLGVSRWMVSRGLEDLVLMRMVTVGADEKGRKFFQLHMKRAEKTDVADLHNVAPVHMEGANLHMGCASLHMESARMHIFSGQNSSQTPAPQGEAPKTAFAIDSITRLNNQTHQPEVGAAGAKAPATTTATAGLSRFDRFWETMPRVIATNRRGAEDIWAGLALADQDAALAGAVRYAAVVNSAPDDRKQYFLHAPAFLRERAWEMQDNDWRVRARAPVVMPMEAPADFW